jgi:DNA-binding NarL/FixJ family response regulator
LQDAAFLGQHPDRLAYQSPANSTLLSEQTSHQQSANSIFLSEQISTSHQPLTKRTSSKFCLEKRSFTTREQAVLSMLAAADSSLLVGLLNPAYFFCIRFC